MKPIIKEHGRSIISTAECAKCGEVIEGYKDEENKVSRWRRIRHSICWFFSIFSNGGSDFHCRWIINTSHPNEIICGNCKHNPYKRRKINCH